MYWLEALVNGRVMWFSLTYTHRAVLDGTTEYVERPVCW